MQVCPYTLRPCLVTLPLSCPFLLLKMRKTCADSAPYHPALDPFHRKERFGREHLWVTG